MKEIHASSPSYGHFCRLGQSFVLFTHCHHSSHSHIVMSKLTFANICIKLCCADAMDAMDEHPLRRADATEAMDEHPLRRADATEAMDEYPLHRADATDGHSRVLYVVLMEIFLHFLISGNISPL